MKVIKLSELRQNLQDVIDSIYYTGTSVIITRRRKPRAIITPLPKDDKKVAKFIEEYEKDMEKLKGE